MQFALQVAAGSASGRTTRSAGSLEECSLCSKLLFFFYFCSFFPECSFALEGRDYESTQEEEEEGGEVVVSGMAECTPGKGQIFLLKNRFCPRKTVVFVLFN